MTNRATSDHMRELLLAGARFTGRTNVQGAVHLLTFTDLPAWPGFAALVDVEQVDDRVRGESYPAALVRHWRTLVADTAAARISSSAHRLTQLAASIAAGEPVDLRDALTDLGHAHARRVLESVAIAARAADLYTIVPTPALAERLARQAAMYGEQS